MQVLPVDPGSQIVHYSLLDLLLNPLVCLSFQLQRFVVILPLVGKKILNISLFLAVRHFRWGAESFNFQCPTKLLYNVKLPLV